MPSHGPFPRLLAPTLLLAVLALPVLSRTTIGQEITTAAPDATPFANATNATEWVMPPEVKALFPKDAVFDEELWKKIIQKPEFIKSKEPLKRARVTNKLDDTYDVCRDVLINYELYGGVFSPSCNSMPIHPGHPHKDKFEKIYWEDIDPRNHVDIIKKFTK